MPSTHLQFIFWLLAKLTSFLTWLLFRTFFFEAYNMLVVQNSLSAGRVLERKASFYLVFWFTQTKILTLQPGGKLWFGVHIVTGCIFKPVTPGQSLWGSLGREDGVGGGGRRTGVSLFIPFFLQVWLWV